MASLAAVLTACGLQEKSPPKPATNPPPVAVTNAAPAPKPDVLAVPRLPEKVVELEPITTTTVVALQAGYLVRQVVGEGALVEAGATLFLVDSATGEARSGGKLVSVTAPTSGSLRHVLHGPGDWIKEGDPLCSIEHDETLVAEVELPRDVYDQHKEYFHALGLKAVPPPEMEIVVGDTAAFTRKADRVSMSFLPARQKVLVQAEFSNADHRLAPGQFARMRQVVTWK